LSPVYVAMHCYNNLHILDVSDTVACLGFAFW